MEVVFLMFGGNSILLSIMAALVYVPTSGVQEFLFLNMLPHLWTENKKLIQIETTTGWEECGWKKIEKGRLDLICACCMHV
jgi:hypothetical protein